MEPAVRQLDLSQCGPGFVSDRVGVVSGLRSSAAFFAFLRANLVLTPSATSSPCSTPRLEPCAPPAHRLAPPGPAAAPARPAAADSPSSLTSTDDIPPLVLDTLVAPQDRAAGLALVADSVAQMERRAVRCALCHPLGLALVAAAWALAYCCASSPGDGDTAARHAVAVATAVASAVAAAYLGAVRLATARCLRLARAVDASWLGPDSDQLVVIGARRGGALVGALVLRLEPGPRAPCSSPKRRGRNRSASLRGAKVLIRAWTTHVHHRRRGVVGGHLLRAAVSLAKDRCGRDARVGFANEHANSAALLPSLFAAPFRLDEVRAARTLETVTVQWEATKKRKW